MLRVVSLCSAVLLGAAALLALPPAASASNSVVGAWRGPITFNGMTCQIGLVLRPNGAYSSTQRCPNMPQTKQVGTYRMFANNTVGFQVDDWEPKIQILPGPNGVNTAFPIRKPPGGTYQYRFTSPNTTVWHEAATGTSITYQRVR